jgi:glucosamine-6-phosphate deaminase
MLTVNFLCFRHFLEAFTSIQALYMKTLSGSSLTVGIFASRKQMGESAAYNVVAEMESALSKKAKIRVIFSCAPSQDEFLAALVEKTKANTSLWSRIDVFHMDDYVGFEATNPQSFRSYLNTHLLNHVKPASFSPIQGEAKDPYAEAQRYGKLLTQAPIDLIALGIGENGHIAFNDPPVANFNDPVAAKIVEIDEICRQQQVNDGCFPNLSAVPKLAISITLPVFKNALSLSCVVPGIRKADAIKNTLTSPIGTQCPATLLRNHTRAKLFIDSDSASLIPSGTLS